MNDHLKDIRSGFLRSLGAAPIAILLVILARPGTKALGLTLPDRAVWTIQWSLVGVAIVWTCLSGLRYIFAKRQPAPEVIVSQHNPPPELHPPIFKPAASITELQERILNAIGHSKFNTAELLSKQLQIGPNITDHQLEILDSAGLIWMEEARYGVPGECGVMPAGRDYLVERGLLK